MNTHLVPTPTETQSSGRQDTYMAIWVGVGDDSRYDYCVVGSGSYWEMSGSADLDTTVLPYLRLALIGQSDSDVSRVLSRGRDPHTPPSPSSDSGLPQISKGMVFYGDISDLDAALDELETITETAQEDECLEPTQIAIDNADLLVKTLYEISPRRYDIYPMSDGEIVIDGGNMGTQARSILLPRWARPICWVGRQHSLQGQQEWHGRHSAAVPYKRTPPIGCL